MTFGVECLTERTGQTAVSKAENGRFNILLTTTGDKSSNQNSYREKISTDAARAVERFHYKNSIVT